MAKGRQARRNRKRAVLIGVNDYRSAGDLRGCVNDVLNMRQMLMRYFDFAVEDISIVTDASVTKKRVTDRIKWLTTGGAPGDQLVLHFSGHGSTIRDFDGDESRELRPGLRNYADELICLHGMDWRDPETYIVDDEINQHLKKVPHGAEMTVILDCCHSGTGTRALVPPPDLAPPGGRPFASRGGWDYGDGSGGGWDYGGVSFAGYRGDWAWPGGPGGTTPQVARYLPPPPDIACRIDETNPVPRKKIARDAVNGKMNHVLLAGCREDQTSADAFIGGAFNGAFTYYLCRAVREAGGQIEMDRLISRVRHDLSANGFEQVAQFEGDNLSTPFLG